MQLQLVPDAHVEASSTDLDGSADSQPDAVVDDDPSKVRWLSLIGIALPEGAYVHPSSVHRLRDVLTDRKPSVGASAHAFNVAIHTVGASAEDATRDSFELVDRVLGALCLPESALVTHRLYDGDTQQLLVNRTDAVPS